MLKYTHHHQTTPTSKVILLITTLCNSGHLIILRFTNLLVTELDLAANVKVFVVYHFIILHGKFANSLLG